jgi:hypothetical protein
VLLDEPDASNPTAERTVVEVEMIGRTQSPFSGTMGAHSTAWIAHLDALQALLRDKSLSAAITVLVARAQAGLTDESLLQFGHLLDEKHRSYLLAAYNALRAKVAAEPGATASELVRVQFLESAIFTYMTYLNFLPMSTVAVGAVPGGRKEGTVRKQLQSYEQFGTQAMTPEQRGDQQNVLRGWLEQLFDAGALQHFPPNLIGFSAPLWDDPAYQWSPTHPLWTVFRKHGRQAPDKERIAHERFYRTLMEAYPRCMVDSGLASAPAHEASKAVGLAAVVEHDRPQLEAMLLQNNCLIHAIADAAKLTLKYEHLVEIRKRIGEVGTMLVASPRTINIICSVLGVGGVLVVYPDPIPSEEFGEQRRPAIIAHTGAQHFVPFTGTPKRKSRSDQHDPRARTVDNPADHKRGRVPQPTTPP